MYPRQPSEREPDRYIQSNIRTHGPSRQGKIRSLNYQAEAGHLYPMREHQTIYIRKAHKRQNFVPKPDQGYPRLNTVRTSYNLYPSQISNTQGSLALEHHTTCAHDEIARKSRTTCTSGSLARMYARQTSERPSDHFYFRQISEKTSDRLYPTRELAFRAAVHFVIKSNRRLFCFILYLQV